jgi:MFS family permease
MNPDHLTCVRRAFLGQWLLGIPFWGLLSMFTFILYKDLHITPFQVLAVIALKPMSALLAPYWSHSVHHRPDRLRANLVWANVLRYLPFLLTPWIDSAWLLIAAFGSYMLFFRGAIPAWMEVVKSHVPDVAREKLVANGSALSYCGAVIMPIILGPLLDTYEQSWRWLFPLTAILGLLSTWLLLALPVLPRTNDIPPPKISLLTEITKPWQQSWLLLRKRPDFAQFQIGFMLCGAGLMIMQPAFPAFFVDSLELSYTTMMLALGVCKGVGFALTTSLWTRLFRKVDIYLLSALVTLLASAFPFTLLGAQFDILFLYLAYGLYGIMQAGSELSWHLSGPTFSKQHDSSLYSSINILTVGIRGAVAPLAGTLIVTYSGSTMAMFCGSLFCLLATRHLARCSREWPTAPEQEEQYSQ